MVSLHFEFFLENVSERTRADVGRLHLEPKCKLTWKCNCQRSRLLNDETPPGPSSPDSQSQVFPADAAVATVSKDNTSSWICTGRLDASAAYVQKDPGWGDALRHFPALTGTGPSSEIVAHKQRDKRINIILCICSVLRGFQGASC